MSFFESLNKPGWIPPSFMFPLAWFTIWALQGWALTRLLGLSSVSTGRRRIAIAFLVAQFVAEMIWQALFGPGRLLVCAVLLTIIWALLIAAIVTGWRADRVAGVLIAPGITWVTVAMALGWWLYQNNPNA